MSEETKEEVGENINDVSILVRREIEALIAIPLIEAFSEAFGEEKTLKIASEVIIKLAGESGKEMAKHAGGNQFTDLAKVSASYSKGNALDVEVLDFNEKVMNMDVTRCRYSEMYEKHGLREKYGFLLSCGRDFALYHGFNKDMDVKRSKTIMEGGDCCDFRLKLP